MTKTYLYIGDHADTLHSGRPVAPGDDPLPASAVTPSEQPDKDWLEHGVLIDPAAERKQTKEND